MRVAISSMVVAQIVAESRASPDREICGLLLGDGDIVREARACRNVADDPARRFEIDPAALIAAYRAARGGTTAVLGCIDIRQDDGNPPPPGGGGPRSGSEGEVSNDQRGVSSPSVSFAATSAWRGRTAEYRSVLGHYHSHPTGIAEPSPRDAADAAPDGALWIIVAGDAVCGWRAVRDGAVHGRFDPVTLVSLAPCAADSGASEDATDTKDLE